MGLDSVLVLLLVTCNLSVEHENCLKSSKQLSNCKWDYSKWKV